MWEADAGTNDEMAVTENGVIREVIIWTQMEPRGLADWSQRQWGSLLTQQEEEEEEDSMGRQAYVCVTIPLSPSDMTRGKMWKAMVAEAAGACGDIPMALLCRLSVPSVPFMCLQLGTDDCQFQIL